jgi:hypothetical protein
MVTVAVVIIHINIVGFEKLVAVTRSNPRIYFQRSNKNTAKLKVSVHTSQL